MKRFYFVLSLIFAAVTLIGILALIAQKPNTNAGAVVFPALISVISFVLYKSKP